MAPSKVPAIRLKHIISEADAIGNELASLSFEGFRDSWLLRRAVEHALLIISEAAKTLPSDLKGQAPGVDWRRLETLGNFLRHEYRDVDPEVVWRITRESLPDLAEAARKLLAELEESVTG